MSFSNFSRARALAAESAGEPALGGSSLKSLTSPWSACWLISTCNPLPISPCFMSCHKSVLLKSRQAAPPKFLRFKWRLLPQRPWLALALFSRFDSDSCSSSMIWLTQRAVPTAAAPPVFRATLRGSSARLMSMEMAASLSAGYTAGSSSVFWESYGV